MVKQPPQMLEHQQDQEHTVSSFSKYDTASSSSSSSKEPRLYSDELRAPSLVSRQTPDEDLSYATLTSGLERPTHLDTHSIPSFTSSGVIYPCSLPTLDAKRRNLFGSWKSRAPISGQGY